MSVQVFPVRLVVPPSGAPAETRADGKPCARNRLWYANWHEQKRGAFTHHAQDIFGPSGSEILAPENAVVTGSSTDTGPTSKGGHHVWLQVRNARDQTVRTYYLAHLRDAPLVRIGDRVRAGQKVGYLGRSGNAARTCPHLHIGARRWSRGHAIDLYPELVAVDPTKRPHPPVRPHQEQCK